MSGGMRVGQGMDAHRLVEGRRLILCGVEIPYACGLLGHSDADVATHAVCDAILGALALGDIGQHFPDTDPAYHDADSIQLLSACVHMMEEHGYGLCNLDCTIIAQAPRLLPYQAAMRKRLATSVDLPLDRVSVKATTTEGMGFCGAGEGIAATAIVLMEETSNMSKCAHGSTKESDGCQDKSIEIKTPN